MEIYYAILTNEYQKFYVFNIINSEIVGKEKEYTISHCVLLKSGVKTTTITEKYIDKPIKIAGGYFFISLSKATCANWYLSNLMTNKNLYKEKIKQFKSQIKKI